MSALLDIDGLSVRFGDGTLALDGVSLSVDRGGSVGIIGESGSGKSTVLNAVLGMLRGGKVIAGTIRFDGHELLARGPRFLHYLRGRRISLIPQAAQGALNPVLRVGNQLIELVRLYDRVPRATAERKAVALLDAVGMSDPARILRSFPHQLSGGQRQRVLVAMAVAGSPDLVLADEPTTALDVTVQARVLKLLDDLRAAQGFALVFVTHQLTLLPGLVEDVLVLRQGRVQEVGRLSDVVVSPRSPYTRMLLEKLPRLEAV